MELVLPTGHTSQIQAMALAKDTSYLASIQNTREIVLWDYQTQHKERTLLYHGGRVNDIKIQDDLLISGGDDKRLVAYDLKQHSKIKEYDLTQSLKEILLLQQGRVLTVGKEGMIALFDLSKDAPLDSLDLKQTVTDAWLDSDTDKFWVSGQHGISLIDTKSLDVSSTYSFEDIRINAGLATGQFVLLATNSGTIVKLEKSSMKKVHQKVMFDYRVYSLSLLDKNTILVTGRGSERHIGIYHVETDHIEYPAFDLGVANDFSLNGTQTCLVSGNSTILIPDNYLGIVETKRDASLVTKRFDGYSYPINDLAISYDERLLAVASAQDPITVFDLSGRSEPIQLAGHVGGVTSVSFHPSDSLLASVGYDKKLRIWSLSSGLEVSSMNMHGRYLTTKIQYDASGKYIIQKTSSKFFLLYDLIGDKSHKLKIDNGQDYKFTSYGDKIVFRTSKGFAVYNAATLKQERKFALSGVIDFDIKGNTLVALTGNHLLFYDLSFNLKQRVSLTHTLDKIYVHPDQKTILGTINSAQKGSSSRDYGLKVLRIEDGELKEKSFKGHQGFINEVEFLKNGRFVLTASTDGQITLRESLEFNEPLGSIVPLKQSQWVAVSPTGIYDASQHAYNAMHYVRGKEKFDLAQLKDLYYEPNLIPRWLDFVHEPLPERPALRDLPPHPEIDIKHPHLNKGVLGLNIKNTGGGTGWVVIKINGKEVIRELNPEIERQADSLMMDYPVFGHPFMLPNVVNKISVKAYNSDGSLSSPEHKVLVFGNKTPGGEMPKPRLFALVVGTDDYPGQSMDLTFAGKDATDFANALGLVSTNFYGEDMTQVTLLSSSHPDSLKPTKRNIEREIKSIQEKASAQDVLVVYLSGHGVNYGKGDTDFYYLTGDATDDIDDPDMRQNATVSSRELTDWIRRVPALQQVLVIDACHSGKLANEIDELTMSSSRIKALENMKDKTGLFILAGSESDAVSYESTLFKQGLLTYSILFGMRGATTDEHGDINILDLFQFVAKKVPELASEIGQVQTPEVKIPDQSSAFAIGKLRLEDKQKIELAGSKPIFIQSGFQHRNLYKDDMHIGLLIDRQLLEESKKQESKFLFVDKKVFHSAYYLKGRYYQEGGQLVAEVRVFKDEESIKGFTVKAINGKALVEKITDMVLSSID